MDSVHKLIEMLEKRFGKFWADSLLLIVILGVVAIAVHALFADLVFPAVRAYGDFVGYFHKGGQVHISTADAWVDAGQLVFTLALGLLGMKWLNESKKRSAAASALAQQTLSEAQDIIRRRMKGYEEIIVECQAFTDNTIRDLHTILDKVRSEVASLDQRERELAAKYPQAEPPQVPKLQDKPSGTSPHTLPE